MKNQILLVFFLLSSSSFFGQIIWEPINFPDTISPICVNAEKEGFLFVSANNSNDFAGLFRSNNEGVTWEYLQVDPNHSRSNISTMKYDQNGILFLETGFGICRSFDNGDNFEMVCPTMDNITTIKISPQNEVYAVGWAGILRSQDSGTTWDILYDSPNNQYFSDIDFGINGEIYVVGGSFDPWGGGFFRSIDNGETWENIGHDDKHLQSVRVNENGIIIVGGFSENSIYKSSDSGITWSFISDIPADIMVSYSNDKLIAGRNINGFNGCWFSEDWGNTWVDLVDSILNPRIGHISVSTSNIIYIQSVYNSSYSHQLFKSINPILSVSNPIYPEIELFPNPAKSKISISNIGNRKIWRFDIYDQNGQKIKSGNYLSNEIEVSNLNPGFYIIELEFENEKVRRKIIIE